MKKLLIGVFAVLLLVIVGEVAYLVSSPKPVSKPVATNSTPPTPVPSLIPTVVAPTVDPHVPTATPTPVQLFKGVFGSFANDLVGNQALMAKNGVLTSFQTTARYSAKVISLDIINTTVTLPANGGTYSYVARLSIDMGEGKPYTLLFSKNDLSKIKVNQTDNDERLTPINLSDIHAGDKIRMDLTINLLDNPDDNVAAINIIKYPAQ